MPLRHNHPAGCIYLPVNRCWQRYIRKVSHTLLFPTPPHPHREACGPIVDSVGLMVLLAAPYPTMGPVIQSESFTGTSSLEFVIDKVLV